MENRHLTDQQQLLAEMARAGSETRRETSTVISPGARIPARVVVVKGHLAYNLYAVRAVVIGTLGELPMEIGEGTPNATRRVWEPEQMEAVNVAESFLSEGTLPSGTYALTTRVGEKNVFYAAP